LPGIHAGERSAIILAERLKAEILLMDDRRGVEAARRRGLRVTGTLGILELAARNGKADFDDCIARLRQTNFRIQEWVLEELPKRRRSMG
jgi:predicted nucleic acid-binding protein